MSAPKLEKLLQLRCGHTLARTVAGHCWWRGKRCRCGRRCTGSSGCMSALGCAKRLLATTDGRGILLCRDWGRSNYLGSRNGDITLRRNVYSDAVMATDDEDGATIMILGLGPGLEQELGAKAIKISTTALNSKALRVIRFIEQCDFPYILSDQSSLSSYP